MFEVGDDVGWQVMEAGGRKDGIRKRFSRDGESAMGTQETKPNKVTYHRPDDILDRKFSLKNVTT